MKKKMKGMIQEKGRKKNYKQFDLFSKNMEVHQRLLHPEEIGNFIEISCRAAACPMPLNADVYDSSICIAKGSLITTMRGELPIEDVIIGDIVLSLNEKTFQLEWKEVIKTNYTQKSKMISIETDIGILRLTEDHRVFTNRGWVMAGELNTEDILLSFEEENM
jgi:DNA polymerase-3 subunit gamma/tau